MKLGVITVLFGDQPLNEALAYLKSIGIEELEVGAGGYPGKAHCNPAVLLKDERKLAEFRETIEKYGMPINAFGCHGNPVHPDKEIRDNLDIFDFTLTDGEMAEIAKLDRCTRYYNMPIEQAEQAYMSVNPDFNAQP